MTSKPRGHMHKGLNLFLIRGDNMDIESTTKGSVYNWEPFAFLALSGERMLAAESLILYNGDQAYTDENGAISRDYY